MPAPSASLHLPPWISKQAKGVNMEKIRNFKQLRVWQKAMEIAKDVYELSKQFPKDEVYSLSSQMRRCAISIPSNIAEGFKRFHNKEHRQFLHVAQGSAAELETQLILSREFRLATNEQFDILNEKIDHLSKMLSALVKKI
jgi:four helix bundle protein